MEVKDLFKAACKAVSEAPDVGDSFDALYDVKQLQRIVSSIMGEWYEPCIECGASTGGLEHNSHYGQVCGDCDGEE